MWSRGVAYLSRAACVASNFRQTVPSFQGYQGNCNADNAWTIEFSNATAQQHLQGLLSLWHGWTWHERIHYRPESSTCMGRLNLPAKSAALPSVSPAADHPVIWIPALRSPADNAGYESLASEIRHGPPVRRMAACFPFSTQAAACLK